MRYIPEYMPENHKQSVFKGLPNLDKASLRMPWDVLEKKRAVCLNLFVPGIMVSRVLPPSSRGASQNKIGDDDDSE